MTSLSPTSPARFSPLERGDLVALSLAQGTTSNQGLTVFLFLAVLFEMKILPRGLSLWIFLFFPFFIEIDLTWL